MADDEAKRQQEAEAAANRQRQTLADTLRDGMAKDQTQASRPATLVEQSRLAQHKARQRMDAARDQRFEAARSNTPEPARDPQAWLRQENQAAVEQAAAAKTFEKTKAQVLASVDAQLKQSEEKERRRQAEREARVAKTLAVIAQEQAAAAEITGRTTPPAGQSRPPQPRSRLAEIKGQATPATAQPAQSAEARVGEQTSRLAERRAGDVQRGKEMGDRAQARAAREADQPKLEETEKRQSLANSGDGKRRQLERGGLGD